MLLINIVLSIFISLVPPSKFLCDGSELHATIYNGLHNKKEIVKSLENLEEDSFVFLEWRDYEIEIPIVKYGDITFANRFWRWSYENSEGLTLNQPSLSRQYPTGRIINYVCKA